MNPSALYAQIKAGRLALVGPLPEREFAEGREWDLTVPENREARGWRAVVETPRPADTDTTTFDYSVTLMDGQPIVSWVARDLTPEELAERAAQGNEQQIGSKIQNVDMPAMKAILDQSNADLNANPASELKDLARAVRRLDRKVLRLLDGSE